MEKHALILLSGGLDSALALVLAQEQALVKLAVTFDYGQKAAAHEIQAAQKICQHYNINHQVISLPFFSTLQSHPFFNKDVQCPDPGADNLDDLKTTQETAKAVWVPNRNGIFLNVAAGLAEAQQMQELYVGFNAEEAVTFPDNSEEYLNRLNDSLAYSTLQKVKVKAPTVRMIKKEIVTQLVQKDFPLSYLWSCYHNQDQMCGHCESCQRLKRALKESPLADSMDELFGSPL